VTELAHVGIVLAAAIVALGLCAAASAVTDFRTSDRQIYCGVAEAHEAPPSFQAPLLCWRSTNGFTVALSASGRVRSHWNPRNRGVNQFAVRVLRVGQDWWSTKGYSGLGQGPGRGVVYRCFSRLGGLTCVNRAGRGFWLGRRTGFSLYE
jgi:hypothetical protein